MVPARWRLRPLRPTRDYSSCSNAPYQPPVIVRARAGDSPGNRRARRSARPMMAPSKRGISPTDSAETMPISRPASFTTSVAGALPESAAHVGRRLGRPPSK
jgi:hypothetical protein